MRKYTSVDYTFTCLTDADTKHRNVDGVEFVDLKYDLPGWWSKIEVFRFTGHVLYCDLDTVLISNIDSLFKATEKLIASNTIMMLRGFKYQNMASGLMAWNDDLSNVITTFLQLKHKRYAYRSEALRLRIGDTWYRGDQEWLSEFFLKNNISVVYAQDIVSGLYSYKRNVVMQGLSPNAKMVMFHGKPRPHELDPMPEWCN